MPTDVFVIEMLELLCSYSMNTARTFLSFRAPIT